MHQKHKKILADITAFSPLFLLKTKYQETFKRIKGDKQRNKVFRKFCDIYFQQIYSTPLFK